MKYALYRDELHAWLKVSIEEIKMLGILENISEKSYISDCRKYAFLEVTVDCQLFIKAALTADWFQDFYAIKKCTNLYYSGPSSFVRKLKPFIGSQFIAKSPLIITNNVFNF